jgi:phage baseplate assembly protein W
MRTLADIASRDWSPKLGAFGEVVENVNDVEQCLRIIWATRVGTVPLRRNFGSTIHRWLDKPFDVAQANVPLAIIEASRWEPRAVIRSVRVLRATVLYGMVVEVDWSLAESDVVQTTTFTGSDIAGNAQIASTDADTLQNLEISDYKAEFLDALNN